MNLPPAPMESSVAHRRTSWLGHLLLGLLTFVPILGTRPGIVAADTKNYLYIDPGKLLSRAPSMWDPNVGLGTLTHQNIGYLFPMGPWYWLFERIGVPDWFAQRLWLSTILFAAGAGVLFLARTLGWRGAGPIVAALAYALGPYVLDYSVRISVILLPWAALPWLIGLTDRALRRGGWRHPALFALVVLGVGGVNATALVFAGLGPVLWIPFAVWGMGRAGIGRAIATTLKIGLLTTALSLWWAAGLAVQGRFGINVLRYTETVETVAKTSLASEVLRGLGYWFFYGNDKLGPWIEPAVDYTQRVWLIVVGFAIPVLALVGAAVVRWRLRAYCATLIVVGTVIAVGAHPYESPSPLGGAFKALATSSTVGLALRSTPRAVPLISLGMALLLGAAITAVARRARIIGAVAAIAVGGLVVAGLPPLFNGDLAVGENIRRPEALPAYWQEAADHLDGAGDRTRVLELPGTDFSSYRWGNTIDPITPYLMDRPYVARELIPYGTAGTADLLNALDRRLQEGVFEADSLAPIARLLRAGDIAVRNDLLYERYRTPRPRVLAELLGPDVAGLGAPTTFGPPSATRPAGPGALIDENELGVAAGVDYPAPVVVRSVDDVPGIVRTAPTTGGMLVAGDGEGLVELAGAGVLDGDVPIRYAASLRSEREWDAVLRDAGALVLTDTNRQRARRWGTVRENTGFTEPADHEALVDDPTDARLDLFPLETSADRTVVQQRGVAGVRATAYGNPISYTPEDRAANALDGDLTTAWRVGAFDDVVGERLRVDLPEPVRASSVRLVQPISGSRNRSITKARLHFDGGRAVDVALGPDSSTSIGQVVSFPERSFRTIEFEVRATDVGRRPRYDGFSGVGLAELEVAGVQVDEVVRLPTSLLDRAGRRALAHPLVVLLSRQRSNPGDPARGDEERAMARTFVLPDGRRFDDIVGTARVAATLPDDAIDRLLGRPDAAAGGVTARSDSRLPGDLRSRASAAIDGDPATAWTPGLLDQAGHWLEVEVAEAITVDRLDLRVVADGRHSVPTRVRIEADGATGVVVDLPSIADRAERGAEVDAPLTFPAVTGRRFRLTVEAVRAVTSPDFFSPQLLDLPVAIAELGLAGVRMDDVAGSFDSPCRDDLVTVDDRPFPVRLAGSSSDAVRRLGLAVEACGVNPMLDLAAGEHELRAASGRDTGIDVDRLVLTAAAVSPDPAAALGAGSPGLEVAAVGRSGFDVRVASSEDPFWLVLGQSYNRGWHLTVDGVDLGPPTLVDGYANGWRLDAGDGPLDLELRWTPQRTVWFGLAASALALMACLGIVTASFALPGRRRRRRPAHAIVDERFDDPAGRPELVVPGQVRPYLVAPIVVVAAFGVAAGPVVGIAAGLVTLAAVFIAPARWLLAFGAAFALAVAGAYVAVQQLRYGYPPDFAWPRNVERAHDMGWLAVALLAASTLGRRLKKA